MRLLPHQTLHQRDKSEVVDICRICSLIGGNRRKIFLQDSEREIAEIMTSSDQMKENSMKVHATVKSLSHLVHRLDDFVEKFKIGWLFCNIRLFIAP